MNQDSEFLVNQRILAGSVFITDLSLSRVFLTNDSRFPWIVLVPRQANLEEIYDLSQKDQEMLLAETMTIARLMKSFFDADKMNIGAIGNKVRQLHMHIVARKENDAAWRRFDSELLSISYEFPEKNLTWSTSSIEFQDFRSDNPRPLR